MDLLHIVILAVIQGVTEFIPVSSSGHLNLVHALSQQPDQGVGMDVALHVGTLIAVMVYFRRDVGQLIMGAIGLVRRQETSASQQALHLIVATLPVLAAAAILLASGLIDPLRTARVVAWASLIFAVPLYLADRYADNTKTLAAMHTHPALLIGLAQILALIPGASRAGVTIMAARALGFEREAAARFSMLLSIPVILCFALFGLIELLYEADTTRLRDAALAAALAAIFAFATIHVFLRMTRTMSLLPFVLYRLALGFGLLWLIN